MRALIIVDMLDDFVTGKLANPKAQAIISGTASVPYHENESFSTPVGGLR